MSQREAAPQDEELVERVLDELLGIRGAKGKLTPQKLGRFSSLVHVLGTDDLLDAFMAFRRELRRYIETANRDEAAAAMSIYADHETVLDRLQETAERFSEDEVRDQRTARRWSDDGMPTLARDLVYMARVRGRLGRELLHIELQAASDGGLMVIVQQMVQADLDVRKPELTLWAMNAEGDPEELSVDLDRHSAAEATSDEYRMSVQRVHLSAPILARVTPQRGLSLAVTGRDAPMRTVSFEQQHLALPGMRISMSAYRDRAAVEVTTLE